MTILVGIRTNVMEFCSRRKIGFGSEYSMGKWEFVAKEQGGVNGWKLLRGNIKGKGRVLLNWPKRILAEGSPR